MKEFEKWYRENCDFSPTGEWADKYVEKAWKAALEWVLNHPDLIDHYMLDYVKEELSGEQGDNQ